MPGIAKALEKDSRLHPIARAVIKGQIVKDKDINNLTKAGSGGQGDVFIIDENFVVKKFIKFIVGNQFPGVNRTIS
jgi:hypothetical protein